MVVSGVPQRNGDKHAQEIALLALDLLKVIRNVEIPHRQDEILQLRIGMHSGRPCYSYVYTSPWLTK